MQINDLSFLTRVDDQMKDSFIFIIFNWDCYYFFLFDWNLCEIVEQLDDSYLGCERWLPSRPKVEKPPSVFNAATLAYIDDSIFEIIYTIVSKMMQLYARRHFLFPPLSLEEHNDCVIAVVRCEAQDALLQKLLNDNYLSEEERGVLRLGKNVGSAKT
ncbi:uncharacterized protein LOC18096746 isoform X3 [Populus trichocarpa]|uniref:uncharacterized protein LOC18096746 isoform X3 n=1 Tax=Populus trichocarpa TaxID=3694 RepID=UPI00227959C1|nr:uncharacterized protein LOC18096746 isoform X3 [Populus trichocarpa]